MRADGANTVSVDRAKQLGWSNVEVIDDDLGRSGGGIARPGFERLLATICDGRVGAVLAIEASASCPQWPRLAYADRVLWIGRHAHRRRDGIYDPRHPNDRLLLGMKGTMSELELSMFRQRSREALKQKARRGALVLGVAAGYVKIGSRSHRAESGQTRAGRPAAGLHQVRRAAKC